MLIDSKKDSEHAHIELLIEFIPAKQAGPADMFLLEKFISLCLEPSSVKWNLCKLGRPGHHINTDRKFKNFDPHYRYKIQSYGLVL